MKKRTADAIKKDKLTKEFFLSNIPNILTISRIVLTFVVVYMIFTRANIAYTLAVFVFAAFTDFLDGQLARMFNWVSEFGRKADMIADRFLWMGTALAFLVSFGIYGELNWTHGLQLMFIMTREIISAPFALIAFFSGNPVPHARYIAKVTTFLQGFAIPSLILSLYYPVWSYVSWPFAAAILITGGMSALHYIRDVEIGQDKST